MEVCLTCIGLFRGKFSNLCVSKHLDTASNMSSFKRKHVDAIDVKDDWRFKENVWIGVTTKAFDEKYMSLFYAYERDNTPVQTVAATAKYINIALAPKGYYMSKMYSKVNPGFQT